jgi:hypothetical protein
LVGGIGGLEFVDRGEEIADLVTGFVDVFGEQGDGFVAALDLGLEVADCAVDIADAAGFGVACVLEVFELALKL